MKRYLWVILSTVIVLAVLFSCVPKQEKSLITVDGDLADWEGILQTDLATDSAWGSNNELFNVGIAFDSKNLYIAGVYTKEGLNNFMCLADLSSLTGATDTTGLYRSYSFKEGNIDVIFESWNEYAEDSDGPNNNFNAWKVTNTTEEATLTDIKDEVTAVLDTVFDETLNATVTVIEAAIPLSKLGITSTTSLTAKAAFAITGGLDNGTQWVGDFCPEQTCGTNGITAPATIDKFIVYPNSK